MSYRITKILCPSCKGTGRSFLGLCQWCDGAKRMPIGEVPNWAEWLFTLAVGGYIAGDHDYECMAGIKRHVDLVCRRAGVPTPDQRAAP